MPKQITDIDKIRRLPWLAVGTLTVNIFMVLAFSGSVFILFLNELGLNKTRIGFLLALIPLCQLLSLFIAPSLARFGFKRMFLLFQLLRNIAMCFILLTPWILSRYGPEAVFPWVGMVIFMFSICRAVSETAIWPWSQEMVPHRMRGKFIAVNNFITTLAVMITVLAAGFIIGRYEGVGKFIVLISVGLFFGFFSLFFHGMVLGGDPIRNGISQSRQFLEMYHTLRDRNFLRFLGGLGLATLALTSLIAFVPLYMKEQIGLPVKFVVWLDVAGFVGLLLSCYLWGWASDRYGSKPIMITSLGLALFLPVFWLILPRHSLLSILLAMIVGLLLGAANIGWALGFSRYLFVSAVPPDKRTTYMAVFHAWIGVVAGLGPLLAGRLVDMNLFTNRNILWFQLDCFTPLFIGSIVLFFLAILIMSKTRPDGAVPTHFFIGMFFQGHTLMAFSNLLRHRWARDEKDRIQTTEHLGQSKSPLSANELIEALQDPSFNVRYEAILAIAHLPSHPKLVDELILILGGSQPELSLAAAWALGKLGDKTAIVALRETLLSEYPLLQARSARALATLGDRESIPFIIQKLREEQNSELCVAYASALGSLRVQEVLPDILNALWLSRNPNAREELSLAAARIVSTEPHYIRLRRKLSQDSVTELAGTILNFKKALNFTPTQEKALKTLVTQSVSYFARNKTSHGIYTLTKLIHHLPLAYLDPTLVTLLQESLKRYKESEYTRREYLILFIYALGRALRYLHTNKSKLKPV